jgi:hypothetical protein
LPSFLWNGSRRNIETIGLLALHSGSYPSLLWAGAPVPLKVQFTRMQDYSGSRGGVGGPKFFRLTYFQPAVGLVSMTNRAHCVGVWQHRSTWKRKVTYLMSGNRRERKRMKLYLQYPVQGYQRCSGTHQHR